MPDWKSLLAEPRQRMLALLGVAAVAGIAVAAIAVHWQNSSLAPQNASKDFLPGFAAKIRQAAKIHIESKNGTFDVAFKPQKGWVLPENNDYPASMDEVRKTLVGLAGLETIEPKTARADWLSYLGLEAPPKGDGVVISVYDDKDHPLASLVAGKTTDIGDQTGATGLFVRAPSSNKSWLVRSAFTPISKANEWMDKTVLNLSRDRIRSVDVDPESGTSFTLSRDAKDKPEFTVSPLPAGRELASPTAAYEIVDTASDFTFDDIKPASDFRFSKAARLVFRTFDGLMVTIRTIKDGDDYWSNIEARPIAGMNQAIKEVREIGAHANGWAYKLPSYRGAQFMPTLESLLKPKVSQ